jgi:putative iron-regulated protein
MLVSTVSLSTESLRTVSLSNRIASCRLAKLVSIASLTFILFACGGETSKAPAPNKTQVKEAPLAAINMGQADIAPASQSPLTGRYLSLASQQFNATCTHAKQFQTAIHLFLSDPNEKTLEEAKTQWVSTHNNYAASKLFRIINIKHPELDHSQIDPVKHSLAIRIDQSPLLAGYLDAVEGYPQSGYVFAPLPINEETLNKEHQFSDTLYVTLGFHAVEFLLWGENSKQARPSTDYAALSDANIDADIDTELFPVRRSQLLSLTTTLLTKDLETQCKEWLNAAAYYPSQLSVRPEEEQNEYIYSAMEQLLSDIQINRAQIKNALEPHSGFANSDQQDLQAQIAVIKFLLESEEWKELSSKQKRTKGITESATALLP